MILYYGLSLFIGIAILGAGILLGILNKDRNLKGFNGFYAAFTGLSTFHFSSELVKSEANYSTLFYVLKNLENPIFLLLLIATLPNFVFGLLGVSIEKTKLRAHYLITFLILVLSSIALMYGDISALKSFRIWAKDILLILVVSYLVFAILNYYKNLTDNPQKGYIRILAINTIIFFPFIVSDTFLLEYVNFKFFPMIYISIGYLGIKSYYESMVEFLQLESLVKRNQKEKRFQNHEFETLTYREKEVAELLIQGKSYLEISTQLYISIHTVKTHAKNLYAKIGVKNRIELMRLTQEL